MAEVKGRMALVLPQGALFRKDVEGAIQQKLLEMNLVEVVIGLVACILVLRKKKPVKQSKQIMIADASRLFRSGCAQNYLEQEQVLEIQCWFEKFEDVPDATRRNSRKHAVAGKKPNPEKSVFPLLVEAAGIEPASESPLQSALHT